MAGKASYIIVLVGLIVMSAGIYLLYRGDTFVNIRETKYQSALFGIEMKYPASIWAIKPDALGTDKGDALYSREVTNPNLGESFTNARYTFVWEYLPTDYKMRDCQGVYVLGEVKLKTVDGVEVNGCKISRRTSEKEGSIVAYYYLQHPITTAKMQFTGRSEDILEGRENKIFSAFDDLITHTTFLYPSVRGLKLVSGYVKNQYSDEPQTVIPEKNEQPRDIRKIIQLGRIKTALENYYRNTKTYPINLNPIEKIIYAESGGLAGTFDGIPISEFHYFKCSNSTYHIGVSLDEVISFDGRGLNNDTDSSRLCPQDQINGSDSQGCTPQDSGRHCYDLIAE